MADIKAIRAAVLAEKAKLDAENTSGFVFITSDLNAERNSVAGSTAEVTTEEAAKHIVQSTAHLSSPAEIAKFKEAGRVFSTSMAVKELARNPMVSHVTAIRK